MEALKACMAIAAAACAFNASAASNLELVRRDAKLEQYMDMDSIKRDGDIVQFWMVTDFREMQTEDETEFFSTRSLQEFSCKNVTGRVVFVAVYGQHAGAGDSVFHSPTSMQMKTIVPQTAAADMYEKLCTRAAP